MAKLPELKEVSVSMTEHVATVEIHRPPHNFFDFDLIRDIADAYEALDQHAQCRAIVLCSEGKNFCAGANFSARENWGKEALTEQARQLYVEATRLFRGLGFHQGFGLSVSLPRIVGQQQASWMLMSGCRVKGHEAVAMGLAEELVPLSEVRSRATAMATEIAHSAPLAVQAIRRTLRAGLADEISAITDHELAVQDRLRESEDFQEGLRATAERRPANFSGR